MTNRAPDAINFENLENRVLFSRINVADFGAYPGDGRDDHAAITRAIRQADEGDVIVLQAGTYELGKTLELKGGVTLRGAGERDTTLHFLVGHGGWGVKILSDSDDVMIENFVLDGGGIAMTSGTFDNVTIRNNEFVNTPRDTFNRNGPAIFSGARSDGLTITGNYIHDTDKYGIILYAVDRLTVANNTFENLMQAGHVMDLGADNTISFNRLKGMVRMGFELQRHGARTAENTTVEGNVITDWRNPFRDSFGLSIVPDGSVNTRVINNYIQGVPRGWDGEWNHIVERDDDVKRMGYGIEYGARSGEVSGNVIGGAFANHIIISGGGGKHDGVIKVKNNELYSRPLWHDWITKESYGGDGFGWTDQNNRKVDDYDAMPQPPSTERRGDERRGERDDDAGSRDTWAHGDFEWLSEVQWDRANGSGGPVETDQSAGGRDIRDGETMTINGRVYEKGLGVAGDSTIVYDLDGDYSRFFSHIGIDDSIGDDGVVAFQVWTDGRKVYDSGWMNADEAGRALDINVEAVRQLRLVTIGGRDARVDHANRAGAKLVHADD